MTGSLENPTLEGRAAVDSLILRNRNLGSLATNVSVSPDGIELRNGKLQEAGGGNLAFDVNIPNAGTDNISVNATLNNVNTGNLLAALPIDFLPEQLAGFSSRNFRHDKYKWFPESNAG
ncbi:MAG: hypothetical protein WKF71_16980 [Pyrinomonadaceae bacterium]